MGAITDVFRTMHVASVVHARLEATAPWGLIRETIAEEGGSESAGSERSPSQFVHFGMVSRGNCWLDVEGTNPIPLTGGDCFLLPLGISYALRDNRRTKARRFSEIAVRKVGNVIHCGGGGVPTTIISGCFTFDRISAKFLRRLLPQVIPVKADQARSLALHTTMQMLASETAEAAPGAKVVVERLAEILFIQCIRAHIALNPDAHKSGWLRAIFDPKIGAALNAMHERVGNPWTVESLAGAAGMSRSAFAFRFKQLLGETPFEYLTNWRVYRATGLLQGGDRKVHEVAKSVGYDSDAAFSKAFKRVLGVAPREFQRTASVEAELAQKQIGLG